MIFVHDSVPDIEEYTQEVKEKNEMEHCSTTVSPNYTYDQKNCDSRSIPTA